MSWLSNIFRWRSKRSFNIPNEILKYQCDDSTEQILLREQISDHLGRYPFDIELKQAPWIELPVGIEYVSCDIDALHHYGEFRNDWPDWFVEWEVIESFFDDLREEQKAWSLYRELCSVAPAVRNAQG